MTLTHRNYHSRRANKEFMSVSQFKAFQKCQNAALAEIKGAYRREPSTALLVGQYVDAVFDGTIENFRQKNPEIYTKKGELRAEFSQAEQMMRRVAKDRLFMRHAAGGQQQIIMTGEVRGVPVKIMMDSYHPRKMIVDRKVMRDFEPIYVPEIGRVPWYEAWGYDVQGAVYQEIVRQNTGEKLPFYLAAMTKETVTDYDVLHLPQQLLDDALDRFADHVIEFDAIKQGVIKPERCGKCDWCKMSKRMTEPSEIDEIDIF